MSSTESPQSAGRPGTSRSPARVIGIVVVVVVVLAAGAYLVVRWTDSDDAPSPTATAKTVYVHLRQGDPTAARPDSTAAGLAALEKISADDVKGLVFGGCRSAAGNRPTQLCVWTRPGGQLSMAMIRRGDRWIVDNAEVGPAGLPPATDTPSSSSTTPPSS